MDRLYRQGDIALIEIKAKDLPKETNASNASEEILAYGEATGHHHKLKGDFVSMTERHGARSRAVPARRFFEVKAPSSIVHEEHGTIDVLPGFYELIQKREYVAKDGERRVSD